MPPRVRPTRARRNGTCRDRPSRGSASDTSVLAATTTQATWPAMAAWPRPQRRPSRAHPDVGEAHWPRRSVAGPPRRAACPRRQARQPNSPPMRQSRVFSQWQHPCRRSLARPDSRLAGRGSFEGAEVDADGVETSQMMAQAALEVRERARHTGGAGSSPSPCHLGESAHAWKVHVLGVLGVRHVLGPELALCAKNMVALGLRDGIRHGVIGPDSLEARARADGGRLSGMVGRGPVWGEPLLWWPHHGVAGAEGRGLAGMGGVGPVEGAPLRRRHDAVVAGAPPLDPPLLAPPRHYDGT